MSYSDYGGYAYKNGERVEDRSDAVLSPAGVKSTPGQWPGWILEEGRYGRNFHALLGDGPIFVGLYKQSDVSLHRLGEEINIASLIKDQYPTEAIKTYDKEKYYVNYEYFIDIDSICRIEIEGHLIEIYWTYEDNFYLYVRLIQPDGTVWLGFSGYGVGAGLENCGYGFSTKEREQELFSIFNYNV